MMTPLEISQSKQTIQVQSPLSQKSSGKAAITSAIRSKEKIENIEFDNKIQIYQTID